MQWNHGFTLLHWAAKNNSAELCARFLARGANAIHRDDSGRSALDYAQEHGSAAALAQLEAGAPSELPPRVPLAVSQKSLSSRVSKQVSAWPGVPTVVPSLGGELGVQRGA